MSASSQHWRRLFSKFYIYRSIRSFQSYRLQSRALTQNSSTKRNSLRFLPHGLVIFAAALFIRSEPELKCKICDRSLDTNRYCKKCKKYNDRVDNAVMFPDKVIDKAFKPSVKSQPKHIPKPPTKSPFTSTLSPKSQKAVLSNINQRQIHGQIAEHHITDTFNKNAVQNKSALRAERIGSNTLNSTDIVVKDTNTGVIRKKVQVKNYKPSNKSSLKSNLKHHDYKGQTIVANEAHHSLENVTTQIEVDGVKSESYTYEQIQKEKQNIKQKSESKNSISKKEQKQSKKKTKASMSKPTLTVEDCFLSAASGAAISGGLQLVQSVRNGDDPKEVCKKVGKAAATGAVTAVACEVVSNVVCDAGGAAVVPIYQVCKTMKHLMDDDISPAEAAAQAAKITVKGTVNFLGCAGLASASAAVIGPFSLVVYLACAAGVNVVVDKAAAEM